MTDRDFKLLSAYIDGELDPADASTLASRLAREPALRARLAEIEALQARLQDAARVSDGTPLPARIRDLLQPQPNGIRALPHRLARFPGSLRQGLAIAASLTAVAALLLVPQWQSGHDREGRDTLLAAALETLPSRASGWDTLGDGRQLRTVLSFPNHEGSWCREYVLTDAGAGSSVRGVACRDGGSWTTRIVTPQNQLPGRDEAAYRPASAGDSRDIASFIDQNAAGDVAGPKKEAELITRSWR
ncbi:MAG: hypothetical protein RJQ10_08310 [Haliea sp.]|uniref:anti-sigma factor family protein n=1 Tax=Haliea sp. TaxID=1932666 RepID=UPI0032EB9D4C